MATKPMTPSGKTITAGQIGKIQELLGAALRKSNLLSEPVQQMLASEGDGLVLEMLTAIRTRVEAISGMISRSVNVNIGGLPGRALELTGRKLYVTDDVLEAMPRDESSEVTVHFFKLDLKGGWISDDDLEKEYALRGLKPAGPYALAAVNQADPAFADTQPNCTHWKDKDGNWCFAAFNRWIDDRYVSVDQNEHDWSASWFFAGVRK